MTCSSGATRCAWAGAVRVFAGIARCNAVNVRAGPTRSYLQIEYHLVELPPQSADGAPSVHGPRLALIAPEVIERLEKEDEHLNLCVR